jgi:predicted GNAT superfamily acetyltransferase
VSEFEIRPLRTLDEFRAAEDVQRATWQSDDLDIVPLHLLLTAAKNGGVVLGAFARSGGTVEQLIGFVFGFIGTSDHRFGREAPAAVKLKHCSHQLGVRPEWQSRGVGYALKVAQREAVLSQGLRHITWTYDPLESRNAHLNITRLGAVCNTYLRNLYGELRDDLNRNLASDRFQVDWWIDSRRVEVRLSRQRPPLQLRHYLDAGAAIVNPAIHDQAGGPWCADSIVTLDDDRFLVEFPSNIQTIKQLNAELAYCWRLQVRSICEEGFARGYSVIDCLYEPGPPARSFYVLQRLEPGESTLAA